MDDVNVPSAPSPAFVPPDEKSGDVQRTLKRELLVRFLHEHRDGRIDTILLWALFSTRTVTPALNAYFDALAVEFT